MPGQLLLFFFKTHLKYLITEDIFLSFNKYTVITYYLPVNVQGIGDPMEGGNIRNSACQTSLCYDLPCELHENKDVFTFSRMYLIKVFAVHS